MSRIMALLEAVAGMLRAAKLPDHRPLFSDVRVQLDPYDLDDVTRESFRAPASRVLFTTAKPVPRAIGTMDLECLVTIAVITKREGRPNSEVATADASALDYALVVAQLVADDPYFGLGKLTAVQVEGLKVAVSEKANEKGLAITLVLFRTTLLEVVLERNLVAQAAETGRAPFVPDALQINGEDVPADELGVQP
jgi:hypothetical protein